MDELVGEHGTAGTLITAPTSLQFAVPDLHLLTPASAHPSHREPSVLPLYAAVCRGSLSDVLARRFPLPLRSVAALLDASSPALRRRPSTPTEARVPPPQLALARQPSLLLRLPCRCYPLAAHLPCLLLQGLPLLARAVLWRRLRPRRARPTGTGERLRLAPQLSPCCATLSALPPVIQL